MLFGFYFKPASQRQRGTDVSCERCLSSLAARFDDLAAVWSVYLSSAINAHSQNVVVQTRSERVLWTVRFFLNAGLFWFLFECMWQSYTRRKHPVWPSTFFQLVAMRLNLTTYNFVLIRAQSYSSLHFDVEVFDCFARDCVHFKLKFI